MEDSDILKIGPLVTAGDFNATLSSKEHWGKRCRMEPISTYLTNLFMENNFRDIKPHKSCLTWYNVRTDDAYVGKRLDRFILHGKLLESLGKVHSRVPNIAISDHCPIILS